MTIFLPSASRRWSVAGVVPAGLLLLMLFLCWPLAGRAEDEPRPALTVSVGSPERLPLARRMRASGDIQAWQEASVGAQTGGLRLLELAAEAGDVVQAGQLLARLDEALPQAALTQARAALLEAEAAAVEARSHAARGRALRERSMMSAQALDQLEAAEKVAEARIAAARAGVAARELDLAHTRVLAPDAGVISLRQATLGEVVNPGQELFRLIRQQRLEWRARLTEAEIGRIRVGDQAQLTLAGGQQLRGTVRRLAPVVELQRREALVYVDLPGAAAQAAGARAGMFAQGEFELGSSEALSLPQQAVVVRDAFSHVFVLAEGEGGEEGAAARVTLTRVKTGVRADGRVEIIAGISERSRVVIDGAGFLNDGDRVRVAAALPAPAVQPLP